MVLEILSFVTASTARMRSFGRTSFFGSTRRSCLSPKCSSPCLTSKRCTTNRKNCISTTVCGAARSARMQHRAKRGRMQRKQKRADHGTGLPGGSRNVQKGYYLLSFGPEIACCTGSGIASGFKYSSVVYTWTVYEKDGKVATKEKTSEAKQHHAQVHYSTHTEQTQRHTDTKTKTCTQDD